MNGLIRQPLFRTSVFVVSLMLFCVAGVAAESDLGVIQAMPEVVVTATRTATAPNEIGSSISVIDRAEIEARKRPEVLDLLRTIPGVTVTQSGGPGKSAGVFLRGAETSQTLVLIDGVRANSNNTGGYDFSHLQTDNIERIEVVRGPQSVLYGSEAMGGVINIITRRGRGAPRGFGRVEVGSDRYLKTELGTNGASGVLDYAASVSYFESKGLSAASERAGNTEKDPYDVLTASARVGADLPAAGRVDTTIRFFDGTTEIDGFDGATPVDDPNPSTEVDGLYASFRFEQPLTNWLMPRLTVGYADETLVGTDEVTEFNNYEISSDSLQAGAETELSLMPWNKVLVGFEFERQKGDNNNNFVAKNNVRSFYLQDQLSIASLLFITAGLRHDNHSTFGEKTTYRLGTSVPIDQTASRLHSSWGTGFRAPSFNQLYFPGFGNPDLKAEESIGIDFGIEQSLGESTVIDLTYFYNNFDDLIAFDFDTFTANNIAKSKAEGIEVTLDTSLTQDLQLLGSYTFTQSKDKQAGGLLPRRPKHQASFSAFWDVAEPLQFVGTLIVVEDRIDSDGSKMDNYQCLDLLARYRMSKHIMPYVRVNNVWNEKYEEVTGYTTPGIGVVFGLEAQL